MTAAERNQVVSIFGNAITTRDALNVAKEARLNAGLELWDPSEVTPLASYAQAVALGTARLAEQASADNESLKTVAQAGPGAAASSCGA